MARLILLLILLTAPPALAQSISVVWEASVPGVTAVAVSPDASTVAIGEAQFTNSVYIPSRTAIGLRDAATGAVTGGFVGGIRAASTLVFDPAGSSIFAAGRTSSCGGGSGNCTSYADIQRVTLDGASLFVVQTTPSFTSVAGSGPYLTFKRHTGYNSSAFSVYEVGPDSLTLVYVAPEQNTLSATFSPDGSRLVTTRDSSGRTVVNIRPVGTWTSRRTIVVPQIDYDRPVSVALSPDNSLLAVDVVPTAGSNPGRIYLIRVSDGAVIANTIHAADSPNEVRYGARLAFTSDNSHIVGVEYGYVGNGTARWVSVFRASDGVRVATRRIGTSTTDPNGSGGALAISPLGGDRFAVAARDYVAVVEIRTAPPPVAGEGLPSAGGLTAVVSPNPAVFGTTVRIRASEAQAVRVEVFDALGRRVAVLFDGDVAAGSDRTVPLPGGALPPGVYVVRVAGASEQVSRRVVLQRP